MITAKEYKPILSKLESVYDNIISVTGRPPEVMKLSDKELRIYREFCKVTGRLKGNKLLYRNVEVVESEKSYV